MRIMLTGGGTGGHTSPAVALVEELRRRDPRLLLQWVGKRGGHESRVSAAHGIPFRGLSVAGWPRGRSLRKIWVGAKLAYATLRAMICLRKFRPQAVLAVGGYVSLPLGLAAQRMGVPVFLHEQNKRLGLANRMLAGRAERIFLSYEDTLGDYPAERACVLGNPVRAAFLTPPERAAARESLGLEQDLPVVLVAGGSQGARSINGAIADALAAGAFAGIQLLWMTGKSGAEAAKAVVGDNAQVTVFPFIEDMATACVAADLIVGRAGASSTAEIAALGKPSILAPYPHAADNHQEENARAFEAAGAAVLMLDDACTGGALGGKVTELLASPDRLAAMAAAAKTLAKPLAAEAIVEEIIQTVFAGVGEVASG